MMKKTMHTLFALILIASAMLLAGCGAQGASTPTPDPAAVYTQVAETVQAQITNNAKLTPRATNTPKPTETLSPSATLRPSSTPFGGTVGPTSLTPQKSGTVVATQSLETATVAPTLSGTITSADRMQYISQTIADGSTFSPLQNFTITWVIKNIGTTTWDNTYQVRLFAGPSLGASNSLLGQTVKPGAQAKITVDMRAPDKSGDYTVVWVITAPDGHNFGSFTLEFKVK